MSHISIFLAGEDESDDKECDDENRMMFMHLAHAMLIFSTRISIFLAGENESDEQERGSPRQSQCKVVNSNKFPNI